MADLNAIADQLSELTVMEAAELATLLEEKWGVSAAAPVAVAAAGAAPEAAAEEQDEFEENNLLIPNEEIMTALKEVVGEEDAKAFLEFAEDIQNEKIENSTILVFKSAFTEKAKRTAVHQLFKRMLKKYESDTLE